MFPIYGGALTNCPAPSIELHKRVRDLKTNLPRPIAHREFSHLKSAKLHYQEVLAGTVELVSVFQFAYRTVFRLKENKIITYVCTNRFVPSLYMAGGRGILPDRTAGATVARSTPVTGLSSKGYPVSSPQTLWIDS